MSGYLVPDTKRPMSVGAQLSGLVRRCGVPDSECEDCVQETWLALLKTHPDWTLEESRTLAWLLAVAHNQALMYHRRVRSHPSRSIDDLDSIPFRDTFPQTDREDGQDSRRQVMMPRLQTCLKRLGEVNRQIVIQRVQQGLTYQEIAEALGLTSEQVRLRFYRASQTLRIQCECPSKNALGGGGERVVSL